MAETTDHIRHLADLFLTRPGSAAGGVRMSAAAGQSPVDAPREASSEAPRGARAGESSVVRQGSIGGGVRHVAELILVGHLPVRAGLWLTQYADDVARDAGPTGLIRLDSEQLILEILRGSESVARASAAATLQEAVAIAAATVGRWVIRPANDAPPGELLGCGAEIITLLSGADEVAIEAAVRQLGALCDAALEQDRVPPPLELAILGADRDRAEQAAAAISHAVENRYGVTVPLRRCVRAMGALGSTLHFRFPSDHAPTLPDLIRTLSAVAPVAPVIETASPYSFLGAAPPPTSVVPAPKEPPSMPVSPMTPPPASNRQDDRPSIATPVRGFGAPVGSTTTTDTRQPSTSPEPTRLRPKPAALHVEPKPGAAVVPHKPVRPAPPARALCSWIAGLGLLPVRCPGAADVEIAADTSGGLHLVAWEDRLRGAHVARAWASQNRAMLALACPDHAIAPSGEVTIHLVTGDPVSVADLYGGDLRLHLLAPVEVEGKTGWYAAALNR